MRPRLASRHAMMIGLSTSVKLRSLVTLSYRQLLEGVDLSSQIAEAYGPDGLGVLTIRSDVIARWCWLMVAGCWLLSW